MPSGYFNLAGLLKGKRKFVEKSAACRNHYPSRIQIFTPQGSKITNCTFLGNTPILSYSIAVNINIQHSKRHLLKDEH